MSAKHGTNWKRLGDGSLTGQDFEEGLGHILDLKVLNTVLFSLFILTAVTVAVSRVDFGHWNMVIAIVIASIKAAIVGTFFMHLKFEGKLILAYVAYPIVILFLLVGGTFVDVADRQPVLPFTVDKLEPKIVIPAIHHGEGEHGDAAAHGSESTH